ncbi:hypothetical protein BDN70DRAFT_883662 [Pholiota conissans]|uniref:MYND-type domain-containing protein n=1 Tax=Pholiota conissans TaxID=109636 RepID=A0A9P6CXD0_9AGAR|nr:hypothetical protein BDN70DRAFT_883662 [Pholiota conissans]
MSSPLSCSVCNKAQSTEVDIKRCGRCRDRFYCGRDCQLSDWPTHKRTCGAITPRSSDSPRAPRWYDKHRKCRDGNLHEGDLELITWPCEREGTGWGHCIVEESEEMKEKFEKEFMGNEKKLYRYWPQAFRWTCCGTDAGMDWGCDHHGTGSKPCSCDFCRMGKPLPDSIYHKDSASRHGLTLQRGPDPRSFSSASAAIAKHGRSVFGLEM